MTVTEEAVKVMKEAETEINRLRALNAELLTALRVAKQVLFSSYLDEKAEDRQGPATKGFLAAETAIARAEGQL